MSFFRAVERYATLSLLILLFFPVFNYLTEWRTPRVETQDFASLRGPSLPYFPVQGAGVAHIISHFGDPRGARRHEGVDIRAERGRPVLAAAAGTVDRVKTGGAGGRQIWINVAGTDLQLYYAHLDRQLVREGQAVAAGEVIGTVGNSGNARHTTPHLHFCVYRPGRAPVDPLPFLEGVAP